MSGQTAFDVYGDGPDVILVHGLGLNRRMWQWQTDALSADFKVVRYDLLGHGESDKPAGPYTMPQMVQQLAQLMKDLGIENAAIVGFSLGALIAQAFALEHADKVTALAILNSAHARSEADRESIMRRVRQAEESGPEATIDQALERWFSKDFAANNGELLAKVRRWVAANDKEVYPAVYKLLAEADIGLEESIRNISCPTLVMTGEEDFGNSPQMAAQIAQKISHAELQVLPGLRHMALAEDPQTVNTLLISFLRENSGRQKQE